MVAAALAGVTYCSVGSTTAQTTQEDGYAVDMNGMEQLLHRRQGERSQSYYWSGSNWGETGFRVGHVNWKAYGLSV